jgi:phosphatidylinositol-3-phosphatase
MEARRPSLHLRPYLDRVLSLSMVAAVAACGVASSGLARPQPVPRLQHVVVVVFENHERSSIVGSADAPTFTTLANTYAEATRYHAVAHPSLPNYLALISGSTHGVTDDCTTCPQRGATIGSQLTRAGVSWGAYAEGYPSSSRFAKKHVPFLYFPGGAGHVHALNDLHVSRLPAFSFVVPDLCHDMHDCSVRTGDGWLAHFIRPFLTLKRTVVFVVFDEGTTDSGGGGEVPLIAAGTSVRRHARTGQAADHYSLLRTIEDALGVPPLGNAARTAPLTGIWQ